MSAGMGRETDEPKASGTPESNEPLHQQPQPSRVQRQQALSALARQRDINADTSASIPASSMKATYSSARSRGIIIMATAGLVVVIIAGSIFAARAFFTPRSASLPSTLTLDLKAAHAGCPADMAWSPDSSRLAVMVGPSDCVASGQTPESPPRTILIFDARSGKLFKGFSLADTFATWRAQWYGGLSWSPDGTQLALPITANPNNASYGYLRGVILLALAGGQPRVITGPSYVEAGSADASVSAVNVWDTQHGMVAHAITLPFPPALTYAWTSDGIIEPAQPLPQEITPGTYIGGPMADSSHRSVSVWQSGVIHTIILVGTNGLPTGKPVIVFDSTPLLWSPDSRYLIDQTPLLARLSPASSFGTPADVQACTASSGASKAWCAATAYPLPDAALAAVVAQATAMATANATAQPVPPVPDIPIAWRPDGKALAAILPGNGLVQGNATIHIAVYSADAHTASTILSVARPYANSLAASNLFFWSPAGQQLAAADPESGSITIWGPGALPK